jgi:hypothetical protein
MGFSCPRNATTFVNVSNDHSRVVASAEADKRCFGGAAEPFKGSNATEYTGPLCPISFLVVLPFFSRILCREDAVEISATCFFSWIFWTDHL